MNKKNGGGTTSMWVIRTIITEIEIKQLLVIAIIIIIVIMIINNSNL